MAQITIGGLGTFNFGAGSAAIETDGTIESGGITNENFSTNVRLVFSDAAKELQEVDDLTAYIAGGSQIQVSDDGDGTVTISYTPTLTLIDDTDSPYAPTDIDVIVVDTTDGNVTVNLPTAVGIAGRVYTFKRTDGGANSCTIETDGAETIDGAGSHSLPSQYDTVRIVSDGSNWLII